jgi:hypothetical protein
LVGEIILDVKIRSDLFGQKDPMKLNSIELGIVDNRVNLGNNQYSLIQRLVSSVFNYGNLSHGIYLIGAMVFYSETKMCKNY